MARGEAEAALPELEALRSAARDGGRTRSEIEILLGIAQAQAAVGQGAAARRRAGMN